MINSLITLVTCDIQHPAGFNELKLMISTQSNGIVSTAMLGFFSLLSFRRMTTFYSNRFNMIEYEIQHLFIPLELNNEISECRMIFSMVAHTHRTQPAFCAYRKFCQIVYICDSCRLTFALPLIIYY